MPGPSYRRGLLFASSFLAPMMAAALPPSTPTPEELAETPEERLARLQALDEADWEREKEEYATKIRGVQVQPATPSTSDALVKVACPEGTPHSWYIRSGKHEPHVRYCKACGLEENILPTPNRQQRRALERKRKR